MTKTGLYVTPGTMPQNGGASKSKPFRTGKPSLMVYNRTSGRLEPEIILGEKYLRFLYGNRFGLLLAEGLLKRRMISRLWGQIQDSRLSARKIEKVASFLKIDLSEVNNPPGGFKSFNHFFTRTLKPGSRPIPRDPEVVISPCDGRLLAVEEVSPRMKLNIKSRPVNPEQLLGSKTIAAGYSGGTALFYRLCPADYHRFHFPEAGVPGRAFAVNGQLHSVNPFALATRRRILDSNLRQRTILQTDTVAGPICMVEVGAMCVGSILQTYRPKAAVNRGDEKGMFRFGGSTVVVMYPPGGVKIHTDILHYSKTGIESLVKVGMAVGTYAG